MANIDQYSLPVERYDNPGLDPVVQATGYKLGILATKHFYPGTSATDQLIHYHLDLVAETSQLRIDLLDESAQTVRLTRENLRLAVDLEKQTDLSMRDSMTGLLNREGAIKQYDGLRHAREYSILPVLGIENRRAGRSLEPVPSQIMFIDVDNFKRINDSLGHPAGDEVLIEIGKALIRSTRSNDVQARWGGDEFIVIMPRASRERVDEAADAIREELREFSRKNPELASTVSIGVGQADFSLTLQDNIGLADRAQINAKRRGKDVVVHFDDIDLRDLPAIDLREH